MLSDDEEGDRIGRKDKEKQGNGREKEARGQNPQKCM